MTDLNQKYKGLINGKHWKTGTLKHYDNNLTAIYRQGNPFYVFEDSVSRFTGYLNTSGDEIYEGDLLVPNGEKNLGINVVFWDEFTQQWNLRLHPAHDSILTVSLENSLDQLIIGHLFTHSYLVSSLAIHSETSILRK